MKFILFLTPLALFAAAPAAQFEVASVKVSGAESNGVRGGCHGIDSRTTPGEAAALVPLGRCVITDGRLSHLIGIAWNLPVQSIQGAPDWVIAGAERFTIEAKAEDPAATTEGQLLAMLRNLLIERFQMKFHLEDKQMQGFALTIGKDGVKFRESKSEDTGVSFGNRAKPVLGAPITMVARRQSMESLAKVLSLIGQMGPITDQTGLAGFYDFRLAWDEADGPLLSTALQEQMGLRLNKQQVPVPQFMFEAAQRPGAN